MSPIAAANGLPPMPVASYIGGPVVGVLLVAHVHSFDVLSFVEHMRNAPVERQRAMLTQIGVDTSDMSDARVAERVQVADEVGPKLAAMFPEMEPEELALSIATPATAEALRKRLKELAEAKGYRKRSESKPKTFARAKHGGYLFRRPGSENWYVKLRSPSGRVEKSLGTSDRREAEVIAGPLITAHKAALLAAKPRVEITREPEYEPGLHTGLDGERIYATATELHYLDETPIRIESNGVMVRRLIARGALSAHTEFAMLDAAYGEAPPRPKAPTKNDDDGILDTYLDHRDINGRFRAEAEATWATYKRLTNNKLLKNATRDDGRLLVKHFIDAGNKTATVVKKIGWLRAAVQLAIDEGKLTFNPFARVISEGSDELRRKPLTESDVAACKQHFSELRDKDQLLFRVLATTGMRLGEAFQINEEQTERGIRYCLVGTKTEASRRRVPFPGDLLPYLPAKISGPLFTGNPKAASKRLNDFLDDCGLTDPSIVVHSLRHRAADRLRAYECPIDIRRAILGHEDGSVSEGYGEGFPVKVLREWIDCIRF
jgi:integrase